MTETNIIKSITVHSCPKCGEKIFAESQMLPPVVSAIFTPEDVEKAKKDCLTRLGTLSIDKEKKDAVEKWLNDPDTIFGPHEVEAIILSLVEPVDSTKSEK